MVENRSKDILIVSECMIEKLGFESGFSVLTAAAAAAAAAAA